MVFFFGGSMTDSVARIKLTDAISADVVDPNNVAPVYADLVTELRVVNGTLHLSPAVSCPLFQTF